MYSFDSKIASRGFCMYCNSSWQNVKSVDNLRVEIEVNKSLKSIDLYACAIKIKHKCYDTWLTVGHIPSEISRHCCFSIK